MPKPPVRPCGPPTPGTLKRYGLTEELWWEIWQAQGSRCAICHRVPLSGRTVIDHRHVKGWKKLPPASRLLYVRGILCFLCNGKCVSKHVTLAKAVATVAYLTAHEAAINESVKGKLFE